MYLGAGISVKTCTSTGKNQDFVLAGTRSRKDDDKVESTSHHTYGKGCHKGRCKGHALLFAPANAPAPGGGNDPGDGGDDGDEFFDAHGDPPPPPGGGGDDVGGVFWWWRLQVLLLLK